METLKPRHNLAEFAQRGSAVYDDRVRPHLADQDRGRFVAIDIETGAYEIDDDDYEATERLLRRRPDAQIWLARIGDRAAYRIGGHRLTGAS